MKEYFGPGHEIQFDVLIETSETTVGRHGGIIIGDINETNTRWNTAGLNFDYIDRNDPRGYRTYTNGNSQQYTNIPFS